MTILVIFTNNLNQIVTLHIPVRHSHSTKCNNPTMKGSKLNVAWNNGASRVKRADS